MSKVPTEKDLQTYNFVVDNYLKTKDLADEELAAVIKVLGFKYPDAYDYLRFVDAYLELRKRKESR